MATGRVNVGGGGGGLNVYCQPKEPDRKNGIWLKYDSKIKNIIQKNDLWTAGAWNDPAYIQLANPPSNTYNFTAPPILNGKMYCFGTSSNNDTRQAQMYDLKQNVWSALPNIPLNGYNHRAHIYKGKIYITMTNYTAGKYSLMVYMFDPDNQTYTELPAGNVYISTGVSFIYDKYLYVLGGGNPQNMPSYMNYLYRYDLTLGTSGTWSLAKQTTQSHNIGSTIVVCVGGYAYYLGYYVYGSNANGIKVFRQDMNDLSKSEEERPDIPINAYGTRGIQLPNGKFVHFSTSVQYPVYEYDLPNGTYKAVNITSPFANIYPTYDMDTNTITAISVDLTNVQNRNRRFYYDSIVLPEGTLAIVRNDDFSGNHFTELISSGIKVIGEYTLLKTGFDDAFIFANGQLQPNVESYYGDGTKWVRYK